MNEQPSFAPSELAASGLSFGAVLHAIGLGWRVAFGVFVAIMLLGLLALVVLKPRYTAQMLLMPKYSSMPNLQGASGGLATLAASALGGGMGQDASFTLFEQSIGSLRLAGDLQIHNHLLQRLVPQQWDASAQRWRPPSGAIAAMKSVVKSALHLPQWSPPDYRDLAKMLSTSIIVAHGGLIGDEQNVYRISFTSDDPKLSADVLSMVYWGAERIVREQRRSDLTHMNAHLEQAVQVEPTQDVRSELVRRILSNETELALLQENQPAATLVLDPPSIPKVRSFPDPKMTMLFAAVLGVILGTACGALYGFFGRQRVVVAWRNLLRHLKLGGQSSRQLIQKHQSAK